MLSKRVAIIAWESLLQHACYSSKAHFFVQWIPHFQFSSLLLVRWMAADLGFSVAHTPLFGFGLSIIRSFKRMAKRTMVWYERLCLLLRAVCIAIAFLLQGEKLVKKSFKSATLNLMTIIVGCLLQL